MEEGQELQSALLQLQEAKFCLSQLQFQAEKQVEEESQKANNYFEHEQKLALQEKQNMDLLKQLEDLRLNIAKLNDQHQSDESNLKQLQKKAESQWLELDNEKKNNSALDE